MTAWKVKFNSSLPKVSTLLYACITPSKPSYGAGPPKLYCLKSQASSPWPSTSTCGFFERRSLLCIPQTVQVMTACAPNAAVDHIKPLVNRGLSTVGYVSKGSHALKAYPAAFIMPSTIARSSASAPQISLAHDMDSGPYATDARDMKKANHFRPAGIVQMARTREVKKPKKVDIDMTAARFRK